MRRAKGFFFYSSLLQQHISQWAPLVGNNTLNEIKPIVTRLYTGKKKSRDARLHGSSMYGIAIKRSGIADLFSFY